jgi:hypothetical protein
MTTRYTFPTASTTLFFPDFRQSLKLNAIGWGKTLPQPKRPRHFEPCQNLTTQNMSTQKMDECAAYLSALSQIKQRMENAEGLFPNYHETLKERYHQMLFEAKQKQLMPPWMAA